MQYAERWIDRLKKIVLHEQENFTEEYFVANSINWQEKKTSLSDEFS